METRLRLVLVTILTVVLVVSNVVAGQHEGHQAGTMSSMTAEVTQCRGAQPRVAAAIEAALKRLDEARQTNSAAIMRAASDDLQLALLDIRTQLAPCAQMQIATPQPQPGQNLPTGQQAPSAPSGASMAQPGAANPAHAPSVPRAAAVGGDSHAVHTPAPKSAAPADPRRVPDAARRPSSPAPGDSPRATDAHAGHTAGTAGATGASAPAAKPRSPSAPATSSRDATAPVAPPPRRTAALATPPTSLNELKCRNEVDPNTAPRMLYQGRTYYFCTDEDRAAFAKDPGRYDTAPAEAAPVHGH